MGTISEIEKKKHNNTMGNYELLMNDGWIMDNWNTLTLWLLNIAMGKGLYTSMIFDDLPLKNCTFPVFVDNHG